jgi:phage terminase small subunit
MKEKAMTPKQELFALEYLKDLNATAAYKRAGYSGKGNSAEATAAQLLRNPKVAAKIQEAMDKRTSKLEITAETVLQEIARLAFVDISQAYDENNRLKPLHEMPEDVRRAIASIEVGELREDGEVIGQMRKVKFWDKKGSLDLLGRHLKLFTDVLEVKDTTTLSARMKAARERIKEKK